MRVQFVPGGSLIYLRVLEIGGNHTLYVTNYDVTTGNKWGEMCVRFVPGGGEMCVRFVPGGKGDGGTPCAAASSSSSVARSSSRASPQASCPAALPRPARREASRTRDATFHETLNETFRDETFP